MTPRAHRIRNVSLGVLIPAILAALTWFASTVDARYVHSDEYRLKAQRDSLQRLYDAQATRAALGRLDTTTREILTCLKTKDCRP